jgi:hypothetical protein
MLPAVETPVAEPPDVTIDSIKASSRREVHRRRPPATFDTFLIFLE